MTHWHKMLSIRYPASAWAVLLVLLTASCASVHCDLKNQTALTKNGNPAQSTVRLGLNVSKDELTSDDLELHLSVGAWGTRLPIQWQRIELQRGTYQWERLDRIIATSKDRGLEPWALVFGVPEYACRPGTRSFDSGGSCPPQPELYQTFLQDFARRYQGRVHYYEIWNEPDFDYFWTGGARPSEYAELLAGAYRSLKAIDPHAQVVMASMAGTKLPYLREILHHLKGSKVFDAVSIHPYRSLGEGGLITVGPSQSRTVADENGREQDVDFLEEMWLYRKLLDKYGYAAVPMWITEYGWGAHGVFGDEAFVSLNQQAQFLRQTYDILSKHPNLLVQGLFWYNDVDWATDPSDEKAQWQYGFFGLVRHDHSPKPVACTFLGLGKTAVKVTDLHQ